MYRLRLAWGLTILLGLAACADPLVSTGAPAPARTGTDICPTPGDDTLLYRSDEFGYCFLYPANYTFNSDLNASDFGISGFYGESINPGSIEPVLVKVWVAYNGPAVTVATASEYANKWLQINASPGVDMPSEPGSLNGHEAVVVRHQPGTFAQVTAFTVVDGRKYSVTLTPDPVRFEELTDEALATWNLVTGSIVFFPPTSTWVLSDDVCPTAIAGTTLHVNGTDGMCFLVPDGWTRDTNIGGSTFTTGEVLGQLERFGDITPRFTLAYNFTQGSSVEEVLQPYVDAGVDPATFQNFLAGGFPGIRYIVPRGPYQQLGGMILAERGSYSIAANPYDPDMFAESIPAIDEMWDTAVNSLQFFMPWR